MPAHYPGKRLLDVVGAAVALVVSMPLQIVIAVTIKIDTGGPVLFRQTRLGSGGGHFQMLKFRTLTVETYAWPSGAGPLLKLRSDPRVTRVGLFLRHSSVDELPQLFNVLRGDMSLVGPRAAYPGEAIYHDRVAPRRLLVKPGMTGLSQVSGGSNLPWDEMVRLDLSYVDTANVRVDLVILARSLTRSLWAVMGLLRAVFTPAPMVR